MYRTCLSVVIACCLVSPLHADDVVSALLPFVPEEANTVVIIRVKRLLDSPRGLQENWRAKQDAEFLAGSVSIGTWFDTIVRGSHVTPAQPHGTWSVGLTLRPAMFSLDAVERVIKGDVEQIAGRPTIVSRRGYFAELTPDVLGVMSANAPRQDFARWVRRSASPGPARLSPYLMAAAGDDSPDILVAVDTLDAPNPPVLRERLASSPVLKGKTNDQIALFKLLVGLQGFRLAINVSDTTNAAMTFDFSTPTTPQAALLKPILIELLEDAGAAIDELRDAQVSLESKSAVLRFTLSDAGLRRVMSLVPMPTMSYVQPPSSSASAKPTTADVPASRRYYKAVNRLVADLQRLNRNAREYQKTATWHDSYAKRIEQLPVVGVDPDMLTYGADIARKLHMLAASLRGTKVDLAALQAQTQYSVHVSPIYGPAGWVTPSGYTPAPWEVASNLGDVRAQQAQAVAAGSNDREQIWRSIEADKVRIRNRMAEKYNIDIDK